MSSWGSSTRRVGVAGVNSAQRVAKKGDWVRRPWWAKREVAVAPEPMMRSTMGERR